MDAHAGEMALRAADFLLDRRGASGLWSSPFSPQRVDFGLTIVCLAAVRSAPVSGSAPEEVEVRVAEKYRQLEHRTVADLGRDATEFVLREAVSRQRRSVFFKKRLLALLEQNETEIYASTQSLARHIYLHERIRDEVEALTEPSPLIRRLCELRDRNTGAWPVVPRQGGDIVATCAAVVALGRSEQTGLQTPSAKIARIQGVRFLEALVLAYPENVAKCEDPYVLSWIVRCLAGAGQSEEAALLPALQQLLALQSEDGSWGRVGAPGSLELTARSLHSLMVFINRAERKSSNARTGRELLVQTREKDEADGDSVVPVWQGPRQAGRAHVQVELDDGVDAQLRLLDSSLDLVVRSRARGSSLAAVGLAAMAIGSLIGLVDVSRHIGPVATWALGVASVVACLAVIIAEVSVDLELRRQARRLRQTIDQLEHEYRSKIVAIVEAFAHIWSGCSDDDRARLEGLLLDLARLIDHLSSDDVTLTTGRLARRHELSSPAALAIRGWSRELALLDIYARAETVHVLSGGGFRT